MPAFQLGIPTANLPVDEAQTPWIATAKSGVYFGWASLALPATHPDSSAIVTTAPTSGDASNKGEGGGGGGVADNKQTEGEAAYTLFPMVMSICYNPFYKNTVRSAEVHLLRSFTADFYGAPMRLLVLGYVRPELDYSGLEALIADIQLDCEVARRSLDRPAWIPRELEEREGEEKKKGALDGSW